MAAVAQNCVDVQVRQPIVFLTGQRHYATHGVEIDMVPTWALKGLLYHAFGAYVYTKL